MEELTPDQLRARLHLYRDRLQRRRQYIAEAEAEVARSQGLLARLFTNPEDARMRLQSLVEQAEAIQVEVTELEQRVAELDGATGPQSGADGGPTSHRGARGDLFEALQLLEQAREILGQVQQRGEVRPMSWQRGVVGRMDAEDQRQKGAQAPRVAASLMVDAVEALMRFYGSAPQTAAVEAVVAFQTWADLGAQGQLGAQVEAALGAIQELTEVIEALAEVDASRPGESRQP